MKDYKYSNKKPLLYRKHQARSAYAIYGADQRTNLVMAKKAQWQGHSDIAYSLRAMHMLMLTHSLERPGKTGDLIDINELISDHLFDVCMAQEKIRRDQNKSVFAA